MPRYFFHLRDGQLLDDPEGIVLDGAAEARALAVRSARSIMAEAVMGGELPLEAAIEIADEQGRMIDCVTFREAIGCAD